MEPDLARLAQLLVEPARAAMLAHLLDGRSWTAGELARAAQVRAPAASAHLKKLVAGGVLRVSPAGRHRYFRLSGEGTARLLEQLQCHAPPRAAATPGARRAGTALAHCRLCYDHIAGAVGVELTRAMVERQLLVEDEPWFRLTGPGVTVLAGLGVAPATGRTCMDWSERRLHLGGTLGASLAHALLEKHYLIRQRGGRALTVTPQGLDALFDAFGLRPDRGQISNSSAGARRL